MKSIAFILKTVNTVARSIVSHPLSTITLNKFGNHSFDQFNCERSMKRKYFCGYISSIKLQCTRFCLDLIWEDLFYIKVNIDYYGRNFKSVRLNYLYKYAFHL